MVVESKIDEKLRKLNAVLNIDFVSQHSFRRQALLGLPDPLGAIIRLEDFVSNLPSEQEPRNLLVDKFLVDEETFNQVIFLFSNSPILCRYFLKSPDKYLNLFPLKKVTVTEFALQQKDRLDVLIGWEKGWGKNLKSKDSLNKEEIPLEDIYRHIREEKILQLIGISLADYMGIDEFNETVGKVSLFAETSIAYGLHYSGLSSLPLTVIAMGKLGGRELNYNSDIDLMFVADNDIEDIITIEILTKKIQKFIDILDRLTADGFVFKVDLRIRPEGGQGPLILTLKQYERYYQTRAQSWEFQALIKARSVGGDPQLGRAFEDFRSRFVFSPDFSSNKMLFSITRIKNTIETFHNSRVYDDVKLSPGGIRDLEFIVQFLQIHHGKITRILNNTDTLSTLNKFLTYKIITEKQYQDFRNHYCFLRRIEHYLQLIDLQPIRKIPHDKTLLIISRMMGYDDSGKFLRKIKKVMDYNRNLFVRIFKLTVAFHEKIEEIRKQILALDIASDTYLDLFENHITHLESDYFLNFDPSIIIEHIRLLKNLSDKQGKLELSVSVIEKREERKSKKIKNRINVSLVTYDHPGIFSLICAFFSVHGISILNGASFLYQLDQQGSAGKEERDKLGISNKEVKAGKDKLKFSSRFFWKKFHNRYRSLVTKNKFFGINKVKYRTDNKKVLFAMEGEFVHERAYKEFSEVKLKNELVRSIQEVEAHGNTHVMEEVLLRSIESIKKYALQPQEDRLKPIQMKVDNQSHPLYTLIDIESEDSFLFLFFFTYALSYKGYYIIKVEFSTPKHHIRNRLFLTNKKKEKVQDETGILELKSSILMIKYFSTFMAYAPNPALAYKTFNRLIEMIKPTDPGYKDYHLLFKDLAKVLGTGEVIMEDFLRLQHGDIRTFLSDKKEIKTKLTDKYFQSKIKEAFADYSEFSDFPKAIQILNQFKDKYLFYLDLRLLTGEIRSFEEFCLEMTTLTDVVMSKAIEIALQQSLNKFSLKKEPGRHAVIALGKWGSREMGYASDVELVFVYDGLKEVGENDPVAIKEFYVYFGNAIPGTIRSKKNGVFELDLRLRPEGEAGVIATSFTKYQNYYGVGGSALNYEKMVLTRLRVISDTGGLGKEIVTIKNRFVYELGEFDFADYLSLRDKQINNLVSKSSSEKVSLEKPFSGKNFSQVGIINLKFSPGGLVEIEYLLQILSIIYGKNQPVFWKNNVLGIAKVLYQEKVVDKNMYQQITKAYQFIRNIINCMRIIRGNAKDMLLPERDSLEMEYLKRTMVNFRILEEEKDLFDELQKVMIFVIDIHNRFVVSQLKT